MNFIQRFIYKRALKAAQNNVSLLPKWRRWIPMRTPSFTALVEEAYMQNPTVYACQLILALTFPEPELWAWDFDPKSGEYIKIKNHPLRQLLAKPNPDMGEAELYKYVITYAPLGGSVFLWKQRDRAGRVMALWPFHRGQMQPIPGRNTAEGLVAYYVLDTGEMPENPDPFGVGRYESERGIAIPKNDVVHWKWMIDPERPWDGLSALVASAGDVDTRNEVRNLVYSLLKNDATPPLVITGAEGDELTDEKVERLGAQWAQKYGGEKRGRPAFLEYGMTVQQLAFSLEQLSFSTLQDGMDAAVCMGYHIHPTVVGAMIGLKSSTYNNQSEAREALAVDTNTPLWRSFASEVQQAFADEPGYGRTIKILFDLQMVRALQENQDIVEKRLRSGLDAGAVTRAEYRQKLGFQVTPGDDVYKESLAMIWVKRGTVRETDVALLEGGKSSATNYTNSTKGKKADQAQTGVMVAFFLPGQVAGAVSNVIADLPNATPANELHLTLVYLGTVEDGISKEMLIEVVKGFAAGHAPVRGILNGLGRFMTNEGNDTSAFYASFDAQALPEFRQDLVDALGMVGIKSPSEHGYSPHITLAYLPMDEATPVVELPSGEIALNEVVIAWGGERVNFALTGAGKARKQKAKVSQATREALQKVVDAQRSIRLVLAGRMSRDVDDYFERLGEDVVRRAGKKADEEWTADDFVKPEDGAALETLLKRYYLEVLTASWDIFNIALESGIQFDENDPNVTRILGMAGGQVKDILETTRQEVAKLLQTANEEGWSVDQIAKGVRDLVVETYKNRAKTIARTELGTAQNEGALDRFEKAGSKNVLVFDNGLTDDDEPCQLANGAVWSIEKARANPLEHPNCTRAYGALFDA